MSQCSETRCGDGYTTAQSLGVPTGEQCDDGNVLAGDGCSTTCTLEPLPTGFTRTLSTTWTRRSVLLDDLPSDTVTTEMLARTLQLDANQIRIINQDNDKVYFEVREYEITCGIDKCEASNTEKCRMNAGGTPSCVCKEGYGGNQCENHLCSRICAHGGRCIAVETCVDCAAGWTGAFCGTAVAQSSKVVAVALSVAVTALLCIAMIVVLIRRRWIPIRARGASSLLGSYVGGGVWVMSALATVVAEDFGLDSGQEEPAGWWGAWLPFVAGFGLWLTANVMHLRAMVKIHIFHDIPPAFFPHMCVVGLTPWAGAALFEKGLIATITCLIALVYIITELAQVWQLRDDVDVVESTVATIVGLSCMLWGRLAVFGTHDSQVALMYPIAVSIVVLVHFLAGSGRLLWLALCDHRNLEILKEYHNDYAPLKGTFRESMVSFDTEVRSQRAVISATETRNNSFTARVGRTKFGQAASKPLRSSSQYLRNKFAPKEGGSFHRVQGSFSGSFTRAKNSKVGVQLSRTSFDRHQFGSRKKLGAKTHQRMGGRRGGAVYDLENSGQQTAADRGAAWQKSAASRVEKQKGTKVAFATPQKGDVGHSPEKPIDAGARGRFAGHNGGGKANAQSHPGQLPASMPGQLPPLPGGTTSDSTGDYRRKYRSRVAGANLRPSP